MIEFISVHPVAVYITIAFVFAVIDLRLDGGAAGSDEAFWLTVMIAFLFPLALVRRVYIIAGKTILWMVTPSNRNQRSAAAEEVKSLLNKIRNITSKSA